MSVKGSIAVVVVGIVLYFVFVSEEDPSAPPPFQPIDQQLKMDSKLSAIVLGGTGLVGKSIIAELAKSPQFHRVTLLGRRKQEGLPTADTDANYAKIDQRVVDFEKLDDFANEFKGYDVCFSTLGTTRKKSGPDGFYRVDHDYVVNSAKLARAGGVQQLHLVSSAGANKKSYFLYPRTKGEVEEELTEMGFNRLSIYRPKILMGEREESRMAEGLLRSVLKVDSYGWFSVDVPLFAKAIVNNCFRPLESKVEIVDNSAIIKMGKEA